MLVVMSPNGGYSSKIEGINVGKQREKYAREFSFILSLAELMCTLVTSKLFKSRNQTKKNKVKVKTLLK